MNNFKFELNRSGVRELLYSSAMKDALRQTAESVAPNAEDYEVKDMSTRAIVIIKNDKAWNDNTDNNTLLKRMHR